MHERALVSQLAVELASLAGSGRVSMVTLALSPETDSAVVEQNWRSAAADGVVEDAVVTCIVQDHGLYCLDCGIDYRGEKLTECPACGGNGLIVDAAPEVALVDWVIEELV
ncbi:MAG: hydrogenase maturation nickel metallochaperone HypA [Acidimicrobiia bacterium]|nr:hydrogenase maturation nickel metallochaperone HypA [Acidimicrobiia bacterium]